MLYTHFNAYILLDITYLAYFNPINNISTTYNMYIYIQHLYDISYLIIINPRGYKTSIYVCVYISIKHVYNVSYINYIEYVCKS